MKRIKKLISNSYLSLILLFFYLPIIYMVIFSFNSSRSLTKFLGFSLKWYLEVYNSRNSMNAIIFTLLVAIIATIISTFVGTLVAIALSKGNKFLKFIILEINNLPMLNPDIVTAISLLLFFVAIGIDRGFLTLLLAHIMFCIPYVVLTILPKLRSLNSNTIEAAMDLGASFWQTIFKVLVPQLKTAIVAGGLIAFTMSIDDFVISYFVSGKISNISILVYTMSKRINPSINVLSTTIVVIVLVMLLVINLIDILYRKKKEKENEKTFN